MLFSSYVPSPALVYVSHKKFNSLERLNTSSPANIAPKIPVPTAWSGLHVSVNQTPPWNGTSQYAVHRSSTRAEASLRSAQGRDDARQEEEEGEEEKGEADASLDHAREHASGTENSRETSDHR